MPSEEIVEKDQQEIVEKDPQVSTVSGPVVDKETGKLIIQHEDDGNTSTKAEPPSPKQKKQKRQELIACPPVLNPEVAAAANEQLPDTQSSDLLAQRELIKKKKALEEEQKAAEAEKKQKNLEKKQKASEAALEKAKAKLEKAAAKAAALAQKSGLKRKLDPDFEAVATQPASGSQDPAPTPAASPVKEPTKADRAMLKLSPKASKFATQSTAHSPNKAKVQERSDHRMKVAQREFQHLTELAIPDLELPPNFNKKILDGVFMIYILWFIVHACSVKIYDHEF